MAASVGHLSILQLKIKRLPEQKCLQLSLMGKEGEGQPSLTEGIL